jgi:hypothetical protein
MEDQIQDDLVEQNEVIDDTIPSAAIPSSSGLIFFGIALGFIKIIFFGGLNDKLSTIIDLATALILFVGIVGLFRDQI